MNVVVVSRALEPEIRRRITAEPYIGFYLDTSPICGTRCALVRVGVFWCARGMARNNQKKRFTITLDLSDYERLRRLAGRQKPRLSLQYLVELATLRFLDHADEDPSTLGTARTSNEERGRRG